MSSTQDDRERLLADAFVGLADSLVANYDVIDVLDRLVGYSVTLLAADAAGIMLVDSHDRLRVVASSCEESDWTELMQIQADEGPCIDCVRPGQPVTVVDLDTAAARWPRFAAVLRERTIPDEGRYRSVHALPLRLRGDAIGGMSLFHTRPGPSRKPTCASARPSPTSPPSASSRNAPSAMVRCSPSSCSTPSTLVS